MAILEKVIATVLCSLAAMVPAARGSVILHDDFESGMLDQWTIGGRQLGTGVAEIIPWNGGQVAHLYHRGYTEITLEKTYAYDPSLRFDFDMAATAESTGLQPDDADYAAGFVVFLFRDSADNFLGASYVARSTSTWPLTNYNNTTNTWLELADDAMHSYSFVAGGLLNQLPDVVENDIATVEFAFRAYASGFGESLTANVWVDNVTVSLVPEPGVFLLLACGCLAIRRRR